MRSESPITEQNIHHAVELYFAHAETDEDLTVSKFADFMGIPRSAVSRLLLPHQWKVLRESWRKIRLSQAIDAVYTEANTQQDFTIQLVSERAGIQRSIVYRLAQDELQARKAMLPTGKEKLTSALKTLLDSNIAIDDLTKKRVMELAGVKSVREPEFSRLYRDARLELIKRTELRATTPPIGENILQIQGGWIDLNCDIWDCRSAKVGIFRKDQLRQDFADVAWSILKRDLHSGDLALHTAKSYYSSFIEIGNILGEEIQDVRQTTQELIERVWLRYRVSHSRTQLVNIRVALVRLFEEYIRLAEQDTTINTEELFRISCWLRDIVRIGKDKAKEDFFSEKELDLIIENCLIDISTGISYIDANPDLLTTNWDSFVPSEAIVVVQWAVALMILLMAFTGLRRESIMMIKVDDWAEIRSGLYALVWQHNKKGEENIALVPALLAQQLQMYVERTAQVRLSLNTERVFLGRNVSGFWQILSIGQFTGRVSVFVKRYHLERDGKPISPNSTLFRRTYATRAMYEGRSLGAIRAALGHEYFSTTLLYCQFDRYEHAAIVQKALDEFGKKALTPWKAPMILDDLGPEEREALLGVKEKRNQDVGICRHSRCVKALQGSPPPCSLCEHLVTGSEFLRAWETEWAWRERELQELATDPEAGMLLAQMRYQFERFKLNFTFIKERYRA